ncbi:chemotaxis protein CheB [Roseateles sp.]|uniref:chemotaxis protein CheB n=1 Tax=Roseateles sp. TaxID=1971397 RepID=UPI00286B2084|nr:chemotaxis protein CheB [Roseateles sp.]
MDSGKNHSKPDTTTAAAEMSPPQAAAGKNPGAIVAIGASAGGLEAFEAFFRACPADTGLGFVLVPHLDPSHESLLTGILQRSTAMPVVQALDDTGVQANCVYIIPPNRDMAILNGVLQLTLPEAARGKRMPIDGFLRSLAADQGARAIGIILSGTASDGSLGLRAIVDAGGVGLVQEPSSARYDGMPQNAIKAGAASHVLAPEQMPALLVRMALSAQPGLSLPTRQALDPKRSDLNKILLQLRTSSGHDFLLYKKSTIGRRIQRRKMLNQIDNDVDYAQLLSENPAEVQCLFRELLINVTSFFRDPEAFVALKQSLLPALLEAKPPGSVFRVWVAGCSSGEEAYSIAMILHELQQDLFSRGERSVPIQIFATDLDDEAIALARAGRYPAGIANDVTPERLRRFFTKEDDAAAGFKVTKELRDMVVFAVQNVIKDPPFSRLDLLSCRNLMIYLEPELQRRLIHSFHGALQPQGVLFVSTSESISNQAELFAPLNRKWKFYKARKVSGDRSSAAAEALVSPAFAAASEPAIAPATSATAQRSTGAEMSPPKHPDSPAASGESSPLAEQIADLSNHALLQTFAPASVTTDSAGNILYIHGDTGRYLRPAPGPAKLNLLEMAREGLLPNLRVTLLLAAGAEVTDTESTTQDWPAEVVSVRTNGGFSLVRLTVRPLPRLRQQPPLLLVSFEDLPAQAVRQHDLAAAAAVTNSTDQPRLKELATELAAKLALAQLTLQTTVVEHRSANEELQTANEELRSSNEELETSKDELQSLNEETITVNAELNSRIEQLTRVQNDMKNLLDSIGSGTLFLDHQLRIRRFTPAAIKIYRLIAGDVGRPLTDITCNIDAGQQQGLQVDLQAVLDSLIPVEREVSSTDGHWYLSRIQPYRTLDNVIEGVVVTFTDISEFKRASLAAVRVSALLAAAKQRATQLARELAEGIVDTVSEPLLVLDAALQVVSASRSFYAHFKVDPADTVGHKVYELGNGQWAIPALRELLENILPQSQVMDGYEVKHDFPGLGPRRMVLNARRIVTADGDTELILLAMVAIEAQSAETGGEST